MLEILYYWIYKNTLCKIFEHKWLGPIDMWNENKRMKFCINCKTEEYC
jgi:hypothetical protein